MGDLAQVAAAAHERSGRLDETVGILAESGRAMVIVDGDNGSIVHANDAAEDLFAGPLGGTNIDRLIPERHRGGHDGLRRAFMRNPTPRPMTARFDVPAITRTQGEMVVRIGLTPIAGGSLVIAEIDQFGPAE